MPLSEKVEDEDLWDDDWNIIDRTIEQLQLLGGTGFPIAFWVTTIEPVAKPIEETNEKSPDQSEPLDAAFVEKVRTADFILSVEAPEEVKAGGIFTLKGTLEYIGEGDIRLYHGVPVIRFAIFDEDGKFVDDLRDHPRVYLLPAVLRPIEPGQKMKVEDTWKIDYPGQYELTAKTTILANKDPWEELFEDKNYERFIRDDMSERVKELTKSKIATDPIEITVING